ncbi:MAG: SDR family oxidoreductase [Acidimicrobiales bacterium]|nr:SDR family oxidoreductase [Acidimicrobiales bacterium]
MFDLSGRVALVTGAGRYIGAGIARTLAAQGAAVAVNDIAPDRADDTAAAIASSGAHAIAAPADASDPDAIAAMVRDVETRLGPIDVLVHNAGIPHAGLAMAPFRELSVDDWQPVLALNLFGFMHCTRSVIDGMCERGFGRIILISSEAGRVGLRSGLSLYGAAKAGAVAFTRHLANEVGESGVTVNAVSLGSMDNQPARPAVLKANPMRRQGNPNDVAAAVVYLASDEASWVTGQTLPVNGGHFTH